MKEIKGEKREETDIFTACSVKYKWNMIPLGSPGSNSCLRLPVSRPLLGSTTLAGWVYTTLSHGTTLVPVHPWSYKKRVIKETVMIAMHLTAYYIILNAKLKKTE